jgi:SAM-dependent methyltransferase
MDNPVAGYHATHLPHDPARARVWQAIAQHLSGWIAADAQVLEIGAGYCDLINNVRAARRVAVDLWPDMVPHAASGVAPMVLDIARDLPALGRATFDVVLASNVLEHFDPDTAASVVRDVAGVLRPGGCFLIVQPNFRHAWRTYFDDYTHRSVFTDTSLPALLRANGFAIDKVEPRFLPYSMREMRVPVQPWMVRLYLQSPFKPAAGQMFVAARRS